MNVDTKFRPPWWLRNPHLQTVYASKFSKRPNIEFDVERIELPDGDFVDLALSKKTEGPLLLMFHGLAGSIKSAYAKGTFAHSERAGFRPVFMHWRGCSGEPNRLARSYHSGSSDDIGYILELMSRRFPSEQIYAIGFSLGANALLKYLGETSEHSHAKAAIAICPPFVMNIGADKLNSGLSKGYQRHLINELTRHYKHKQKTHPHLELTPVTQAIKRSFWSWDDAITAPVNGFNDVHHYYENCSCRQYLKSITVPTKILYSLDDPFFSEEVLPTNSELSSAVELEVQRYGGHVGFVFDRNTPKNENWLDNRVAEYLSELHTE